METTTLETQIKEQIIEAYAQKREEHTSQKKKRKKHLKNVATGGMRTT
jgi:hypothetical protein